MFVKLSYLASYIDCYNEAYFNPYTYTCCCEDELTLDSGEQFLRLPRADLNQIARAFIHQSKMREKLFRKISEDSKDFFHEFCSKVEDEDLNDEWWEHRENALCDIAAEWCDEHFIVYTRKK